MPTSIIRQKLEGSSRRDPSTTLYAGSSRYLQAGLVAVVAVGDEDRLGGHQPPDGGVCLLIGQEPEPVFDPQVIGRHQRGAIAEPDSMVHYLRRGPDRARRPG